MTITIKLKTGNAAFEDRDAEIARILVEWAAKQQFFAGEERLRDYNGNTCGSVKVTGR